MMFLLLGMYFVGITRLRVDGHYVLVFVIRGDFECINVGRSMLRGWRCRFCKRHTQYRNVTIREVAYMVIWLGFGLLDKMKSHFGLD